MSEIVSSISSDIMISVESFVCVVVLDDELILIESSICSIVLVSNDDFVICFLFAQLENIVNMIIMSVIYLFIYMFYFKYNFTKTLKYNNKCFDMFYKITCVIL